MMELEHLHAQWTIWASIDISVVDNQQNPCCSRSSGDETGLAGMSEK